MPYGCILTILGPVTTTNQASCTCLFVLSPFCQTFQMSHYRHLDILDAFLSHMQRYSFSFALCMSDWKTGGQTDGRTYPKGCENRIVKYDNEARRERETKCEIITGEKERKQKGTQD